nr:beta-lactamase family protein [Flavisolibacter sp.]
SYSNAGYQLLAAIIENASGTSFENYLNKNLWTPAGMFFTGNQLPKWDKKDLVGSYDISGNTDTEKQNLWGEWGVSLWNLGAGGILSTLNDLYKWHEALNSNKILSPESKEKLFTPYAPFKAGIGKAHYTYGWAIQQTPLGTLIEHNGGNGYNYTDFYRYIDKDLVMIYFTNERQTYSLRTLDSIPSALYGKPLPAFPKPQVTLTLAELKPLAGVYELPSGKKLNLQLINNVLSIHAIESETSRLLTNFPELQASNLTNNLESRIENVLDKIAKDSIKQIQKYIDLEGTIEQEKAYWDRTFSSWRQRFGTFKEVKIIGSRYLKNFLVSYAILEFEKGTTIVEIRQNEQKKFFVGHPSLLLPRYYRLIPQSKTEFLIHNHSLQTSTKIILNDEGMIIQNGKEIVLAKKTNSGTSR